MGKKLTDANRLSIINPILSNEWDFDKNKGITPNEIAVSSNRKVWWKCSACGYSWEATVGNRNRGRGCPRCSVESHTSFPEQAVFYYLEKTGLSVKNRYICCGYEVDIYIEGLSVGIEYDGIRYHSSKRRKATDESKNKSLRENGIRVVRIKEIENDELICTDDAILYKPRYNYRNLDEVINRLFEILDVDYDFSVDVLRDRQEIQGRYVSAVKEHSIEELRPDLLEVWDWSKNKVLPSYVSVGSEKVVWWICNVCKSSYRMSAGARVHAVVGCPYCAGRKIKKGLNDLLSKRPELAKTWDYEKNIIGPDDVFSNSAKKVWWKCTECGESYLRSINSSNSTLCKNCGVKRKSINRIKRNIGIRGSFKDCHPELMKEWDYDRNADVLPDEITSGSHRSVWWKCSKCNHSWKTSVAKRVVRGQGCGKCSSAIGVITRNDNAILVKGSLEDNNKILAREWDYSKNSPLTPHDVTTGSSKKVWWTCSKGHSWQATVKSRNYGGRCPFCINRRVLKGYNDLLTVNPELAMEWNYSKNVGLLPEDVVPNSNKRVWWICSKGHEWQTTVNIRTQQHTGCPFCVGKKK